MKKLDTFLILILFAAFSLSAQSFRSKSIWEKGKEAERQGNYQLALQIWETARSNQGSSTQDPRIGFDYIELATQQKLTSYYQNAVEMYSWSLSDACSAKYKTAFKQELDRISPIISDKEYQSWEEKLNTNTDAFCKSVLTFWEVQDPTISRSYNERLIEHWERIAHSKKSFKRSKLTVYDTDDRGIIYVRFGEPDIKKNGTLQFNNGLVRTWIQDILDSQSQSRISLGSLGGDSAGTSSSFFAQANNETLKIEELTKEALLTHRHPYYEVWVYRELNDSKFENLVYIFGQDGDDGTFGLRNSLDEMIPSSAFRTKANNRGLVTSGLLLQLLYYEQTSQIDTYFEEAFRTLESRIVSRNGLNRRTSFIVEDQNRSQLASKQYRAPAHKTSLAGKISNIEIESHQYRLLDKNNNPRIANFVESSPHKAAYLDQVKEEEYDNSNYKLIHKVVAVSTDNTIVDEQLQTSKIYLENTGSVLEMKQSEAYFETPNVSEVTSQIFSVELHNNRKDSTNISGNTFTDNIRAIGKVEKNQPAPLSTDNAELELSDILLGVDKPDSPISSRGPTSFLVIHDQKIPANNNLMIHFQVYHLSSQEPNSNKFSVEYKVEKEDRSFFKRIFGNKNQVGLTLNFETFETYSVNNLEIDTTPFEAGKYELNLKVREEATNREVERNITFEILDN